MTKMVLVLYNVSYILK